MPTSYANSTSLAIGEDVICFLKKRMGNITALIYPLRDILHVELLTEHTTVSTGALDKEGPAKISRALVGGLLAGPTGAVIGGLSGNRRGVYNTTSTSRLKSISLLVTVKDIDNPLFTIPYLDLAEAKKWESILKVAVEEDDQNAG